MKMKKMMAMLGIVALSGLVAMAGDDKAAPAAKIGESRVPLTG